MFGSGCAAVPGRDNGSNGTSLSFISTSFTNNSAMTGVGGAVAVSGCNATFEEANLQGNQAMVAGAVYAGLDLADTMSILMTKGSPRFAVEFDSDCDVSDNVALLPAAASSSGSAVCAVGGVSLDISPGGTWTPANAAGDSKSGCNPLL